MLNLATNAACPVLDGGDLVGACRELTDRVARVGYAEFVACASPLRFADTDVLKHARGSLSPELECCAELLYFGASVDRDTLVSILGADVVEALVVGGIFRRVGHSALATSDLVLTTAFGLWYFHQAAASNPKLYFGEDSIALAWRQRVTSDGRVLDLCSGPGFQLIQGVRHGATGVGVEINRFAASTARINADMNGLGDRVEFRVGNLYEQVGDDERFDLIIANPPFLPCPGGTPYAFVGDGGPDGLELTWTILEGLPKHLRQGGVAHMIGGAFSDGLQLCVEDRLREWARSAGIDLFLTTVSALGLESGSEMRGGCVANGTDHHASGRARTDREFGELIESIGATHLCGYFLRAQHGQGKLSVLDLAPKLASSMFFV